MNVPMPSAKIADAHVVASWLKDVWPMPSVMPVWEKSAQMPRAPSTAPMTCETQ